MAGPPKKRARLCGHEWTKLDDCLVEYIDSPGKVGPWVGAKAQQKTILAHASLFRNLGAIQANLSFKKNTWRTRCFDLPTNMLTGHSPLTRKNASRRQWRLAFGGCAELSRKRLAAQSRLCGSQTWRCQQLSAAAPPPPTTTMTTMPRKCRKQFFSMAGKKSMIVPGVLCRSVDKNSTLMMCLCTQTTHRTMTVHGLAGRMATNTR